MKKAALIFTIIFLLGLVGFTGVLVYKTATRFSDLNTQALPPAQPYSTQAPSSEKPTPSVEGATHTKNTTLPQEINLSVPFISQAPKKIWDEEHEEFCEEAVSLMSQLYIQGAHLENLDEQDARLQAIKAYEEKTFGYYKDTTADETMRILTSLLGITQVTSLPNPRVEDIKNALANKKIVLLPAAGQLLGNPHFKSPGPLYHMVLIKGYTRDGKFITHDPGTQFGSDYLYPESTLMNAMHDWHNGDVLNGKKVILIVG